MAKKKINIKLTYDAPVTLTFVFISLILFVVNSFLLKGKLTEMILTSPTTREGVLPFAVQDIRSYFRMIFYVFGSGTEMVSMLCNLIFILLLGPAMEDRYGSVITGIMILISAVFSGVLNACFCQQGLTGCVCVVFMMIFLNAFLSIQKKKLPCSFLAVFVLFIFREVTEKNPNGAIGIIVTICGGLCGSLLCFLASPKVRAAKKESKSEDAAGGLLNKAEQIEFLEELDKKSPRFFGKHKKEKSEKKSKKDDSDSETTVIGTLKF